MVLDWVLCLDLLSLEDPMIIGIEKMIADANVMTILLSSLVGIVLGILIGVSLGYLLWGGTTDGD